MTTDRRETALQLVRSRKWRWMAGMQGERSDGELWRVVEGGLPGCWLPPFEEGERAEDGYWTLRAHRARYGVDSAIEEVVPPGALLPDLDAPATQGCLLAMLREAGRGETWADDAEFAAIAGRVLRANDPEFGEAVATALLAAWGEADRGR